MNIDEIIDDLHGELQVLEDIKTKLSDAQENVRESISMLQMIKVDVE